MSVLKIIATHPRDWAHGGYKLKDIEVRHVELGGKTPTRMDGNVSYDGIGQVVTEDGFANLRDKVTKFQPHILFFGIHMGFDERQLKLLRARCKHLKFVMHFTDQRPSVARWVKAHGDMLDLLLITNLDADDHKMYEKWFGKNITRTFYDGVSTKEFWPRPTPIKYDCIFGGNNFWGLNRMLEEQKRNHPAPWIRKFTGAQFREEFLLEASDMFNVIIRGQTGWDSLKETINLQPMVFHPNYLKALREAKIILNTINVQRHGLLTRRFLRSMASGRLFMTEYCSGMENWFTNHKHLVWFKTIEEGLDLIRYYLDHNSERERIARLGRKEMLERHTFRHRLKEFAELMRREFNV